jgi:hypothetical protein
MALSRNGYDEMQGCGIKAGKTRRTAGKIPMKGAW